MNNQSAGWPLQAPSGAGLRKTLFFTALLLIPVTIIAFVTYRSTRVESGLMENSLHRQAEMVSRGLEASLNIGMMHSAWTKENLQDLLDANTSQSGASLIFLSSPEGVIASSNGPMDIKNLPEEIYSRSGMLRI